LTILRCCPKAPGDMPKVFHHLRSRRVSQDAYSKAVAAALGRDIDHSKSAIKEIMRWTGASERCVKNWLSGRNGPSGVHLIGLMARSDQVFWAVHELAGREATASTGLTVREHLKLALEALPHETKGS
jgi:hypothetical protein